MSDEWRLRSEKLTGMVGSTYFYTTSLFCHDILHNLGFALPSHFSKYVVLTWHFVMPFLLKFLMIIIPQAALQLNQNLLFRKYFYNQYCSVPLFTVVKM